MMPLVSMPTQHRDRTAVAALERQHLRRPEGVAEHVFDVGPPLYAVKCGGSPPFGENVVAAGNSRFSRDSSDCPPASTA